MFGRGGAAKLTYLLVGLGNPGREYERTRHNAGFRAADKAAAAIGVEIGRRRFRALVGEGRHAGSRVVIIKPQTFMNDSGASVVEAVRFYKIDLSRLILVYDDFDIPLGTIRVRPFGGPGTHNGMRSVIGRLGGREGFPRVRIGIGAPARKADGDGADAGSGAGAGSGASAAEAAGAASGSEAGYEIDIRDYVLGRESAAERSVMEDACARAAAAALDIIELGAENAMNKHNIKNAKNAGNAKNMKT